MKLSSNEFIELLKELQTHGEADIEVNIDRRTTVTYVEQTSEYNLATGDEKRIRYTIYGYGGSFEDKEYVVVNKAKLKKLLCY